MRKFFIILIVAISLQVGAQGPQFFYRRFGGHSNDKGYSIVASLNGAYIITGSTNSFGSALTDVYLTRLDTSAQPVWQKNIGGMKTDVGKSVVELADSSIVIAGYTNSFGSGGYDAYIVRTDKIGNVVWQKTFGGGDWDFAYSIDKTSNNQILVCGTSYSFGKGDKNAFILRMNINGDIIWSKVLGGEKDDVLNKVIETKDGNIIAVGTTKSYGDSLGDIWITKLNQNGDSLQFITKGGAKRDVANSIVQDRNGDYLIAGGSESFTNGKEDAYILKLSPNLSMLWDRYYGRVTDDEEVFDIKNSTSATGSMVVCYTTRENVVYQIDAKVLLLDANGFYIDGGRVGSYGTEEVFSIANCTNKGYILAGYTTSFNAEEEDVFIIKFDSLVHGKDTLKLGLKERKKLENTSSIIYPVPFSDKLVIRPNIGGLSCSVEIYDQIGNLLFVQKFETSDEIVIDDLHLHEDTYIVKILSSQGITTTKIYCQR